MAAGSDGPVAIAVSGGSDSLALMLLADVWARRTGRQLRVLTVDHGLRREAADEARHVADRAKTLGHHAEILRWTPDRRSQQAARTARHKLIARAAQKAGARLVLFGHTRTDIEETLLMRLSRPSSLTGAVGPQPVSVSPVWPDGRGVMLGRPLCGERRDALMAWLRTQRENWTEDPTNESDTYERPRIRKLTACLDTSRLARITADAMRLRAVEDAGLAQALRRHVSVHSSGLIQIDHEPASGRISRRKLSIVLQLASGTDRPVAPQSLQTLNREILDGGPAGRVTLGGAWVQRRGGHVLIGRDPGEVSRQWCDGVWDGRYIAEAGVTQPAEIPFLVRHAVPEAKAWREIMSDRLSLWIETLDLGARLAAELAGAETMAASTRRRG